MSRMARLRVLQPVYPAGRHIGPRLDSFLSPARVSLLCLVSDDFCRGVSSITSPKEKDGCKSVLNPFTIQVGMTGMTFVDIS